MYRLAYSYTIFSRSMIDFGIFRNLHSYANSGKIPFRQKKICVSTFERIVSAWQMNLEFVMIVRQQM